MEAIKRNGTTVPFDKEKIVSAIRKVNLTIEESERMDRGTAEAIASSIEEYAEVMEDLGQTITVEEIQDEVIRQIQKSGFYTLAKEYIEYRFKRALVRKANTTDDEIGELLDGVNEECNTENANKNAVLLSTQRDYMAGIVSKDLTNRTLLPPDIVAAHKAGIIHFHDADYFAQHMHNCDLVNMEDMLQNGTVISGTKIEKPHSFSTACNVATQIVAQVASSQYGGQSFSLAHLSPFVEVSRQKFRREVAKNFEKAGIKATEEQINTVAEEQVLEEINKGIQTIQYQLVTLMTTNGQTPFVTMFLNLFEVPEGPERDDLALCIKEVLDQRIKGTQNEQGVWITPAFPKLIYMLDEDNTEENSEYLWLTELAAKCTAKRMVPDYISAKVMRELKQGDLYTCMGCRSFLTVDRFTDKGIGNIANAGNYKESEHKYYGRFNQGVVTLNLVDVACSSEKDPDKFWAILNERLDMCHRALRIRHERLLGTKSDVAPILWQYGALARLKKGETIDRLLYDGYSTISLGYAGLYECVKYMTGESHTSEAGKPFALQVMQALNDACFKWKAEENIDYSVYGTPIESTTYKFARCLQQRFGKIEGITDHEYITNSYHVNVREKIDAFTKLTFESEFQKLSPGGAISYVEVPNLQGNIPAVIAVIRHIYDNIMYAELNTKSDYCMNCGFDGEIVTVEDEETGKLVWECPNCGNRDQRMMSVARRTCGYIGANYWCEGRTREIAERVMHLGVGEFDEDFKPLVA